jgi:hypothetical protein
MPPHIHRCPACRDLTIAPGNVRGLGDRILALVGWRPYRCLSCHRRFYDRPSATGVLVPAGRLWRRDQTP